MTEENHLLDNNDEIIFDELILDNLIVIITEAKEQEYWIAQGLQINYFAYGNSPDEVKKTFKTGLIETVKENLKRYGNIIPLLEWAPHQIINEYWDAPYTLNGDMPVDEEILPVKNLKFMKPAV